MNAKEYLMQIRIIKAKVESIEDAIKEIRRERQEIGNVAIKSSWPDGQPHGTMTTDPTGTQATRLADKHKRLYEELSKRLQSYETDLITERSRFWSKHMEVMETLSQVDDVNCYKLLKMRYVDGAKWELIAVELDKTYQWVAGPLHGRALAQVQELINKK